MATATPRARPPLWACVAVLVAGNALAGVVSLFLTPVLSVGLTLGSIVPSSRPQPAILGAFAAVLVLTRIAIPVWIVWWVLQAAGTPVSLLRATGALLAGNAVAAAITGAGWYALGGGWLAILGPLAGLAVATAVLRGGSGPARSRGGGAGYRRPPRAPQGWPGR
jgi:hypothetical protein